MMGLQYRESSSEDEAPAATEVIEIPDEEDDDVMSVGSGWRRSSVFQECTGGVGIRECSYSVRFPEFLQSQTGISPFSHFASLFSPLNDSYIRKGG